MNNGGGVGDGRIGAMLTFTLIGGGGGGGVVLLKAAVVVRLVSPNYVSARAWNESGIWPLVSFFLGLTRESRTVSLLQSVSWSVI